jgi:small subunit ribosomal protein S21
MIIINVKEFGTLDRALKALKKKVEKTGQTKEVRKRREFTKPSVKRRDEVKNAKHRQHWILQNAQ